MVYSVEKEQVQETMELLLQHRNEETQKQNGNKDIFMEFKRKDCSAQLLS